MELLIPSFIFWSLSFVATYLVARHLDKTDYSRRDVELPEESDHIYKQNEAYNRYQDKTYDSF